VTSINKIFLGYRPCHLWW